MIRLAGPEDIEALYAVFFDAIRDGAAPHYTEVQRRVWAPNDRVPESWPARLAIQTTWAAEEDGRITGFLSLGPDGYLDLFYVRPECRGAGISAALYDSMMDHARQSGIWNLSTHASLLLRPFLERRGWQVGRRETVTRHGIPLDRFEMSLEIPR